jgi:geranylgeranyl diphosphate synthase type II
VFPGGARIRPQLCLAVANACGDDDPTLADAAAVAIELLHCASLVHDDLPCFDDAPTCAAAAPRCTGPMASRWPCWPAMR